MVSAMVAGGADRVHVLFSALCSQCTTNAKRKQIAGPRNKRKIPPTLPIRLPWHVLPIGMPEFSMRPKNWPCTMLLSELRCELRSGQFLVGRDARALADLFRKLISVVQTLRAN